MRAQLTVTVAERAVAFRDLPLESFFISRSAQGTAKIRRKVSKDACCGIGRNPVRMLMRPSAMILPIAMPEIVAIKNADALSSVENTANTKTRLLRSRSPRAWARDAYRDPYQEEWRG